MSLVADHDKATLNRFSPTAFFSARAAAEQQLKRPWKSEGGAYALALLAHLAAWQTFQALPPPPTEEPPIIEATLVLASPAEVPAAPAMPVAPPPQPVQQTPKPQPKPLPKPKPKPLPKPIVKKPDRPKPIPTPQAEAAPSPPTEAPAPAPVVAPRAAPKAESTENTLLSGGSVSGFDRYSMPRIAREEGWEGTVTLKFRILADGDVAGIQVVGSSGHEVLDEHAVHMLKNAHIVPCRRGDTPVDCPTSKILPIHFKLEK
jgi:protein TonB